MSIFRAIQKKYGGSGEKLVVVCVAAWVAAVFFAGMSFSFFGMDFFELCWRQCGELERDSESTVLVVLVLKIVRFYVVMNPLRK
jgi:hypothetical protein